MPTMWSSTREEDRSSHLTVELFAERDSRPMPFCPLLSDEVTVERSDAEQNDPELAAYFERERFDGEAVKRLNVTAEERITSIYGCVVGATDLISADISGKSDPYCIVEAVTKDGTTHFIYRTRVIKGSLNPEWGESFFFQVPPDPNNEHIRTVISKVQFSVY